MNLIIDRWIPARRQSGKTERIAPYQIAEMDDPVVDLDAPRPDFQGALDQFLIGLLQTTYAPKDDEEWDERFESPDIDDLKAAFMFLESAMNLHNSEGPAFLQELGELEEAAKSVSFLLIDAPGEITVKENRDHFVKDIHETGFCFSCTASALFTVQTNSPAGVPGFRVGLRGGGPLTTLLIPESPDATLWQKLWLNVQVLEDGKMPAADNPLDSTVLPWMGPTRISDKKGKDTRPEDGHPLQMYWGMPRRIRLEEPDKKGTCSLCGAEDQPLVSAFRTKNYGTNYTDYWIHPLTPFRYDPKQKNPPLSLKGQQGGLGYRHWIGLALGTAENGDTPATVVDVNQEMLKDDNLRLRLWCFGYDMDNMKARCWYEQTFPVLTCDDKRREQLLDYAAELIELSQSAVKSLRGQVKEAWFSRPKDAKGDISFIEAEFWQNTELRFFDTAEALGKLEVSQAADPSLMRAWQTHVLSTAMDTFDRWTLESNPEDLNLKRIMKARKKLQNFIAGGKVWKRYNERYPLEQEDIA